LERDKSAPIGRARNGLSVTAEGQLEGEPIPHRRYGSKTGIY